VGPVPAAPLATLAQARIDVLMKMIARIATPLMAILLLVGLGLAFVARAAQKLDLMSVSKPLIGAIAVLIGAVLAGNFVSEMRGQISLSGLAQQIGRRARRRPGGVSGVSGVSG
ncbi:flagellar biosynthetic protein FliR, partial [Burkholderia pseudomallei]|uniref:flagellar biosynthetic protein FliR n=1 Tax=Burkholderia pseudomallei TaxID=28450 RepID=UPI0015C2E308